MFNWHSIDLHFHTKEGFDRKKKNDKVDFNYYDFTIALISANIKLAAATNHNYVYFGQYVVIKYLLSIIGINYLMGVESDTNKDFVSDCDINTSSHRHIVLIFKDLFHDNFLASIVINKITREKLQNSELFFDGEDIFNSIVKDRDVIIIPHGDKDKGYLNRPTAFELKEIIHKKSKGFIRVVDQKTDWEMAKLKNAISKNMEATLIDDIFSVLFTDTRKWKEYSPTHFVINSQPTYEGFAQATFNPKYRFNILSEIEEPPNYISKIEISLKPGYKDGCIKPGNITMSPRYNCVIGKSGSGKTLLSYLIKKKLSREFVDGKDYAFSDSYDIKILNGGGLELDKNNFCCVTGISIFQEIIKIMDGDRTNITEIARVFKRDFTARKLIDDYLKSYDKRLSSYCDLYKKYETDAELLKNKIISLSDSIKTFYENEEHISLKIPTIPTTRSFVDDDGEKYKMNYGELICKLNDELDRFKSCTEHYQNIKELLEILTLCFDSISNRKDKRIASSNLNYLKVKAFNSALANVNGCASSRAQKAITASQSIQENIKNIAYSIIQLFILKKSIDCFDLSINIDELYSVTTLNDELKIVIRESLDPSHITSFDPQHNSLFRTYGFTTKITKKIYDLTKPVEAKKAIDNYIKIGVLDSGKENQFASDESKLNEIFSQEMTID